MDALNPKYIQFKSRDSQHKKTNSYSLGGLTAAFSSYNKAKKDTHNHYANAGHHQLAYQTVDSIHQSAMMLNSGGNGMHAGTFIENPHHHQQELGLPLGGTPSSNAQGTKRSLILQ